MSVKSRTGAFMRWAVTWPIIVILALNIENWASGAGYSTIISERWKDTLPVLSWIYGFATSAWVFYPALILLGAVIYEWAIHVVARAERPGSKFQRWLIKYHSDVLSAAFLKDGAFRKWSKPEEIEKMNNRLSGCGLTQAPESFAQSEAANKIYGGYFLLLSKGEFDLASEFIGQRAATLQELDGGRQLPEGTES